MLKGDIVNYAGRRWWVGLLAAGLASLAFAMRLQADGYLPCLECVRVRAAVVGVIFLSFAGYSVREVRRAVIVVLYAVFYLIAYAAFKSWDLLLLKHGGGFSCAPKSPFPEWFPLDAWFPVIFSPQVSCGETSKMIAFGSAIGFSLLCYVVIETLARWHKKN